MTQALQGALGQALMITAFVAVMMMAVEYLNVLTQGTLDGAVRGSPLLQYVVAVALGATPGCLGAFTVVALYSHRVVTVGAVVAAMIATSGDEAFVMLGLFPGKALLLMLGLAALGMAVAPLVDRLAGDGRYCSGACGALTLHQKECDCFARRALLEQWRRPGIARVLLTLGTVGYGVWVVHGGGGMPPAWNWVRITLLLVGLFGAFIVGTVPDHFLREHLWEHVARRHVPRIFAWTAAVLLGIALLSHVTDLQSVVGRNPWWMLAFAGIVGLIPESGPNLVFVTLYAAGGIPMSVLATNSIVQDGHGMLPLLAQSRREFMKVKAVNLLVGLSVGAAMLALGR